MAVLNKDDFFSRLNSAFGTDTSDDTISFIEDMTDTYNDLEQKASNSGENWEQRYHDLDAAWKKKYQARFFSSPVQNYSPNNNEPDPDIDRAKTIQIADLFTVTGQNK